MNLEKKHIAIAIIVVVLAVIAAYALGCFDFGEKTEFDNKFISGTFNGKVVENTIAPSKYSDWVASYLDKENNIEYNMSCIKNGGLLMDIYSLQGLPNPEIREYNGVSWNIYYSQAVPTPVSSNASSQNSSSMMNVYICEGENNGASYLIYIISSSDKVKCDGSMYCDLFTKYIEPMLKSISYHDNSKAPQLYNVLGISKEDMKTLKEQVKIAKSGNPA